MAMTLKQVFTMWACEPGHTALAARSHDAVQKILMKKYNDVEVVQFTPSLVERIFRQSKEAQELKTKAASILVHVLNYGAEKGYCSKPTFTYDIANPMNAQAATDKQNVCEGCNNVKGCITCVDGDQLARIMEAKPKNEETMRELKDPKEKKPRGRKPSEEKKESTAAADALKVFTDDELLDELDRRGWYGEIRKIQVVTLGKKED